MKRPNRTVREYATTSEVARILGVSEISVRTYARTGQIPAYRVGKLWRFDPKAIREFIANKAQREYNDRKGA